MRSCWSTPIQGRTGIVGTFAVYHDHPHRPPLRERRLVDRFTHLASVAIDHAGWVKRSTSLRSRSGGRCGWS